MDKELVWYLLTMALIVVVLAQSWLLGKARDRAESYRKKWLMMLERDEPKEGAGHD